jgi:putative hydrolase
MYSDIYSIKTDTHCHTVASTHAYSTVVEMAAYARKSGFSAIAITDHGPAIPDGAHEWHFGNLRSLPPYIDGVRVLHGAEANILDFKGNIDINKELLKELDWIIASFHDPVAGPATVEQATQAYLAVAENPYVDVIGHSGTESYKYDYEKAIPVFGQKGKLVEINSHSFEARSGAKENCLVIAQLCKKYRVPIVVNSDAHSCFSVGEFSSAIQMLASIEFPPELILNRTFESLAEFISKKRNRNVI